MKCVAAAIAVWFGGTVASQQTVIVGPNPPDLATAVAAAGPWDTMQLPARATYAAITVDKPLCIVGMPGMPSVIQGLTVVAGPVPGFVSLSSVDAWNVLLQAPTSFENVVIRAGTAVSTEVSLHRCAYGGATNWAGPFFIRGGEVRLTACTFVGRAATSVSGGPIMCQTIPGSSAIDATGCQLWLADTTAIGGADHVTPCLFPVHLPASPAIIGSGDLHISGGSIRGGTGTLPYGAAPAVQWSGTFAFDPATQFVPTNYMGAAAFLPASGGSGAPPGGTIQAGLASRPSIPAVLAASLGMPRSSTWPQGPSWLDPNALVVLRIGLTDPGGRLGATIPVPPTVARGLVVTVQGAAVSSTTGNLASAVPVVLHVL